LAEDIGDDLELGREFGHSRDQDISCIECACDLYHTDPRTWWLSCTYKSVRASIEFMMSLDRSTRSVDVAQGLLTESYCSSIVFMELPSPNQCRTSIQTSACHSMRAVTT
jgi:hypothetical protein